VADRFARSHRQFGAVLLGDQVRRPPVGPVLVVLAGELLVLPYSPRWRGIVAKSLRKINVLAFDSTLTWDINRAEGASMLGGEQQSASVTDPRPQSLSYGGCGELDADSGRTSPLFRWVC
jgi:hypothetical protein